MISLWKVRLAGAAALTVLAGCAGIELGQPPPSFDLNGTWRLLEAGSETAPDHRRLRARGGMLAFITQDFPVLGARELRIEQGGDSMGIYYDGKEYRDVSWGERRRGLWDVQAGWHEGSLWIISKAADADAREVLTLSGDGRRLTVDVRVESRGDDIEIVRVFELQ